MNPPRDSRSSARRAIFPLASVIVASGLIVLFWHHRHETQKADATRSSGDQAAAAHVAGTTANPDSNVISRATSPQSTARTAAPLPSQITDGKDTNSIRQWAHNELEVQRMLNENEKIYRRQLVVLKEAVASVVERNRLTGEQIQQLTLAGLDGQEIAFEVKRADIEPSGLRGTFHGFVAGRPDSLVTLAFLQNRQAYTILSPSDNLYLDVEPHDPGDVIVKSIDLEKYGAGLCGAK